MVNKMGMTREQANQVIQATIGALQPIQRTVQDTVSKVKQQSAELGTKAVDRMGTVALWLAILAIITLGLSTLGGTLGIAMNRIYYPHVGRVAAYRFTASKLITDRETLFRAEERPRNE